GGYWAFALTMAGDFAKGMVAMAIARALFPDPVATALAGAGAILGHDASLFLRIITGRFRGGAGTATFAGGAIFLWPPVALLTIPVVPVALYLTGYASVASTLVVLAVLVSFAARVAGGL